MRRVLIADDHPPARVGIRSALEHGGFEVCAEVATAPDAVVAAREHEPDIALLDIHMPGNGITAAAQIGHELPRVAIVMLTVSREDQDLFDALKAGASGYLLKDTDPDRLPEALKGVLSGEAALPRALAARLIDEFRRRDHNRKLPLVKGREVRLTQREWEALDMMREGLSTADMAERLGVSQVTVRSHISGILRKLHVSSREEAIRTLDR